MKTDKIWSRITKVLGQQDVLLVILITMILAAVVSQVPTFWHVESLFNILRDSMVDITFALGVMLVLISGGIDVSFFAIGIVASYTAVKMMPASGGIGAVLAAFTISILIGMVMGAINAAVVISTKVTTLIATLATFAIFTGGLYASGNGVIINVIPEPLQALGQTSLFTAPAAVRGTTRLNVLILVVIAVCILLWALLRYTVLGRSIYAVGGDPEAAMRAAVPVRRVRCKLFMAAGALYGLAGIINVTLSNRADPVAFTGRELDIIAAVVLGGVAITGGKGTVRGAILGVILIRLIRASLVPLGVPSSWAAATVGVLLLLGITLQGISARAKPARPILESPDGGGPAAPGPGALTGLDSVSAEEKGELR